MFRWTVESSGWGSSTGILKNLSMSMGLKFLCSPASSVPCERVLKYFGCYTLTWAVDIASEQCWMKLRVMNLLRLWLKRWCNLCAVCRVAVWSSGLTVMLRSRTLLCQCYLWSYIHIFGFYMNYIELVEAYFTNDTCKTKESSSCSITIVNILLRSVC